jgi:hypothetical protein
MPQNDCIVWCALLRAEGLVFMRIQFQSNVQLLRKLGAKEGIRLPPNSIKLGREFLPCPGVNLPEQPKQFHNRRDEQCCGVHQACQCVKLLNTRRSNVKSLFHRYLQNPVIDAQSCATQLGWERLMLQSFLKGPCHCAAGESIESGVEPSHRKAR